MPDKLVSSFVMSPDKKSTAVPHGQRPARRSTRLLAGATNDAAGERIWYEYRNSGPAAGTNWYVAVPGLPVCTAQVTFKDAAPEDAAKKIGPSWTQANQLLVSGLLRVLEQEAQRFFGLDLIGDAA